MRTGSFLSWLGPVIRGLRSTPRRVWWTSFVLVTLLSALWSLANPPFAGPDEPAHVIRAHALAHGEITGKEPSGRVEKELSAVAGSTRVVRAPEVYRSVNGPPCFALQKGVAACLNIEGSTRDVDVETYVADQPPMYHALAGAASWVHGPGSGAVYLMRFLSAVMAGALIATAITALYWSGARQLLRTGLVLAVTPMVLFMGSVVNPGGPEVAASVAFWACGLVLVLRKDERVDNRLVTGAGVAGCVLALSRQLGPLWLGLIVLFALGVSNGAVRRNLVRSSWARVWGVLVLVAVLAQTAWDVVVRPRDASLVDRAPADLPATEVVRGSIGGMFDWYREMIGWFGWVDTPAPVITWLLWTAGVGFLFFAAFAWANWRFVAVLLALLAAVLVVPVIVQLTPYGDAGVVWQGRNILPLAVGIPILAAFALASTERGREIVTGRFTLTLGIIVVIAHVLAFAQNLRRYTVGYDGDLQYWKHPEWLPPVLSPLLFTLAYAAVVIGFTAWLLWPGQIKRRSLAESSANKAREETPRV